MRGWYHSSGIRGIGNPPALPEGWDGGYRAKPEHGKCPGRSD